MPLYRRILVPVDGSATANEALTAALNLAREGGSRLLVVHVIDELALVTGMEYSGELLGLARDAGQKALDAAAERAQAAGVPAETRLVEFPAQRLGETVAELAREWGADLVVVGTHGRRGISRVLLGSGAEQVIRQSPVPVLSIRGKEAG